MSFNKKRLLGPILILTLTLTSLVVFSLARSRAKGAHSRVEPPATADQMQLRRDMGSMDMSQDPPAQLSPRAFNRDTVMEGESFTLTPRGFEPGEIARDGGPFVLNINNRSGFRSVEFLLTRANGNQVRTVRIPKGRLHWRGVVNLPPGRYRLSEVSHSDWVCQLIISGNNP